MNIILEHHNPTDIEDRFRSSQKLENTTLINSQYMGGQLDSRWTETYNN